MRRFLIGFFFSCFFSCCLLEAAIGLAGTSYARKRERREIDKTESTSSSLFLFSSFLFLTLAVYLAFSTTTHHRIICGCVLILLFEQRQIGYQAHCKSFQSRHVCPTVCFCFANRTKSSCFFDFEYWVICGARYVDPRRRSLLYSTMIRAK